MAQRRFQAPRGIRDLLPEDVTLWEHLEATASRLARQRGFREIRPALLEETGLFTRSVGEVTDIVEKEMFSFEKGKNSLTLRPEGTAGIVRAYVEAGYPKTRPVQRLFNIGPMFRYERPQKGRERMFTQFDVEALGSLDPRLDAEVIQLASLFFEELGVTGIEVRINSMGDGADRDRYREAVRAFLAPKVGELCELCQLRFERSVLRVLDCKNEGCRQACEGSPEIVDYLDEENTAHFGRVRSLLDSLGREAVVDPKLVRGFDYYTRTVFELHSSALGARSALCGGGRYDHLVRDVGGPDLGAVGFAIGFTGTLIVLDELGLRPSIPSAAAAEAYLVMAGPELEDEVFLLAESLRRAGVSVLYDVERKSLKSQMKAASGGGHRFAILLGPEEIERGVVQLKDLTAKEQREFGRGDVAAAILAARPSAAEGPRQPERPGVG